MVRKLTPAISAKPLTNMVEGQAEGYNFIGKPNPNPENKQLLIIPGASHCDLYDGGEDNYIPWDTLAEFFTKNLK